ncbi:hypothetical protein Bhyg_11684 [Pseudolycoriella hygida]|uniref:CCHC-type domain-containing protein n=1 Tax=Pseudolycoriella hygida TaxID=35572 RepID=A0A9Q0MW06_9DIPT|nr:hypothetical protein Bhyg_11684 [Pseudolycoriella hygida]
MHAVNTKLVRKNKWVGSSVKCFIAFMANFIALSSVSVENKHIEESDSKNSQNKNSSNNGKKEKQKGMALAGNIEPHTLGTDFDSYEDRINQFFIVNEVEEDVKTALFIIISGEDMYEILKSLTQPAKPSTKTYKELIELLQNHFTPKRNKRALLFNEESADFEKCCQKALQYEMVEKESKSKSLGVINAIRPKSNRSRSLNRSGSTNPYANKSHYRGKSHSKGYSDCSRCGRQHNENTCPARDWKCYSCEKTGHIAPMCRSKVINGEKKQEKSQKNAVKSIFYRDSGNYVQMEGSEVNN